MKSEKLKGQAIVAALIAIIFMAGIGFAMIVWFRSETGHTVQKEKHSTADDYGKAGVDRGIFYIENELTNYKWKTGQIPGNYQMLTVTMEDGTPVQVEIEEIGAL